MAQHLIFSVTFVNDGGPLIVLPRELLGYWQGASSGTGHAGSSADTDYTRACKAAHPAALLNVGPGFGLVIGSQDHFGTANWITFSKHRGAALVGWSYGDDGSEARIAKLLCTDCSHFQRLPGTIQLCDGDVVLLHAASAGNEIREVSSAGYAVIGDGIPLRLEPRDHLLEVVEAGGDLNRDTFGCVICRWVPLQQRD